MIDDVEADLIQYYDQEGDARLTRPLDPRRVEARARFVASLGAERRRVLEIGSGPGRDAAAFVDAGHDYVAVDLSMEHARRCRATGANVGRASVRDLPFRTGAFGAIWSMSTLMHVPNRAISSALAEVARVLAPGGEAAIGVWGGPDVEDRSPEDGRAGKPARLFSRRSDGTWKALLTEIGEVTEFERWGDDGDFVYQWAVVRRR